MQYMKVQFTEWRDTVAAPPRKPEAETMKTHARVGTVGYQELNDAGTQVMRLLDANGAELPAGAVYGYDIVEQKPTPPVWAAATVGAEK